MAAKRTSKVSKASRSESQHGAASAASPAGVLSSPRKRTARPTADRSETLDRVTARHRSSLERPGLANCVSRPAPLFGEHDSA